jgi:hypothetical protein
MQTAGMNGQHLPPFPAGFGFPPQPASHPSQLPATPTAFPPLPVRPTMPAAERVQEIMESDKEDGEVSEVEVASHASARIDNGRAHPEPPRSVPQAKPQAPRVEEAYNPDQPAAGQMATKAHVRQSTQQTTAKPPRDTIQQNREHAKQFIKLLHSNNIGYRALAKESLDLEQLRGLYQSLNLPSEPAPILPPKPAAAEMPKVPAQASMSPAMQAVSRGSPQQQKQVPTIKTNINAAPSTSAAPSPVVDRRDYIARLQATKLAKLAAAAKASPPREAPPVVAAPLPPPVAAPQVVTTQNAKPPVTDELRARNTELIKQRLEVMKAQQRLESTKTQKTIAPSTNGTSSASSVAQKIDPMRSAGEQATRPSPSNATAAANQSYVSPFPGIPGLFMNPPPSFDNTASRSMPSIPQKRPAPPDSTEVSTPRGSVTPYTRPLGDSPHAYHEEPMIIEVSDDESNGSDMDIDDDQAPSKSDVVSPSNSRQPLPGSIADFPSQPPSVLPGSSAVSTPGPQTPTTHAREQELKKKEDQLAAMRMTLKKKLAEKREKDKAAAAAAIAGSPAPQSLPVPAVPVRSDMLNSPIPAPGASGYSRVESDTASSDVLNDAGELIRDVKRRRREEIESRLPSFDAELAVNTNKMAQLMREMELLKAQNEKITEDRERLTNELENLGIDTEGMSHAEMQAKKDEIEQETLPDPAASAQSVNIIPTETASALENTTSIPTIEANQDAARPQEISTFKDVLGHGEVATQHARLPGIGRSLKQIDDSPSQATTKDEATADVAQSQSKGAPLEVKSLDTHVNAVVASEAQDFTTPVDEDEDFYSPAPAVDPLLDEGLDLEQTTRMDLDVQGAEPRSPSEEGEVEMSVSSEDEEEEYEPEEPTIITETPIQAPIQDAQTLECQTAKSVLSNDITTEDEEVYEPPDVDQEMPNVQVVDDVADAEATDPEVDAEDGAMDIASSSSEDSDSDSESDGEITSNAGNDETRSASLVYQPDTDVAIELAREMRPEPAREPVRPPLAAKLS